MDLETLKSKLMELDRKARDIIKECAYSSISNKLEHVKWDLGNPDEAFLHDEIKDILNVLDYIHYKLSYLQKPVTHEGVLRYTKKKGYEIDGVQLHHEDRIEALVLDEQTQNHKWELHYLTEHSNLIGTKIRIRELGEDRE